MEADASMIKRLKELETENTKLKKMYAERSIEVEAMRIRWKKSHGFGRKTDVSKVS